MRRKGRCVRRAAENKIAVAFVGNRIKSCVPQKRANARSSAPTNGAARMWDGIGKRLCSRRKLDAHARDPSRSALRSRQAAPIICAALAQYPPEGVDRRAKDDDVVAGRADGLRRRPTGTIPAWTAQLELTRKPGGEPSQSTGRGTASRSE